MTGLLTVRDTIRDFLRKYDEITTPLLRFVAAFIVFHSINKMYGYSSLFDKSIILFLMSVICALVSDQVAVLVGGVMILVHAMSVSLEIGVMFLILVVLIYCMYMRMFQECGWILAFVPIMLMLKLYYAVPLVVVIFSGAAGIVPTAFGVILYYFSICVREIQDGKMLEEEKFQAYTYIVDGIIKNKNILAMIIAAAIVILLTYIIYMLPFDYSWYVAIGVGGICNMIVTSMVNSVVGAQAASGLVGGSLLGIILALFVQVCKRVADYSKKESVQFEDDDYYYYVKAIPKYNMGKKEQPKKEAPEKAVSGKEEQERKNAGKSGGSGNGAGQSAAQRTAQRAVAQNRSGAGRNGQRGKGTGTGNQNPRSSMSGDTQVKNKSDR